MMIKLKKLKKRTWIIIGTVMFIVLVLGLGLIRKGSNGLANFEFVTVERGNLENIISSTGALKAKGTVEVGTQVSGTIDKVYADFNDTVKKNEILTVLDTTLLSTVVRDAEANLLRAQAQYNLSLTKYEDAQELYKGEYISELDFNTTESEHESARANLLSAQASLDRANANLNYAVIRSPINGTVINRIVEPGQTVAASFSTPTLFVIAEDLSQMEIHANVDESDIGQIKQGQAVRFTVESYPDETFHGTVREIRLQPQTIQNVVNYTVVVDAANVNGLLLPGMTATIDFVVEQRKDVLLISNTALRFQPSQEMLAELRKTMMEKIADLPDSVKQLRRQEMDTRMQHTGFPGMGAQNEPQLPDDVALLWYFDDKNKLSIIPARIGTTDGQKTEIVQGHNIKEGMEFISSFEKDGKSKSSSKTGQAMPRRPPIF